MGELKWSIARDKGNEGRDRGRRKRDAWRGPLVVARVRTVLIIASYGTGIGRASMGKGRMDCGNGVAANMRDRILFRSKREAYPVDMGRPHGNVEGPSE